MASSPQVPHEPPQPSSPLASHTTNVVIEAGSREPVITLQERVLVTGHITTVSGQSVGYGVLTAERQLSEDEAAQMIVAPVPFTTTLQEDGHFEMWVDPGVYDLRVNPDISTGQPAVILQDMTMDGSTPMDIVLPPPGLAYIKLMDAAGAPTPSVTVELYQPGSLSLAPTYLVKGTSDEAGRIHLIIPFLTGE